MRNSPVNVSPRTFITSYIASLSLCPHSCLILPSSHLLSPFPQDDYRVCVDFNIIQKDSPPVCPVDASGCFTEEVTDFAGQYVKVCISVASSYCFSDVSFIILLSLISFLLNSFYIGFFFPPGSWFGFVSEHIISCIPRV